MNIPPKSGPCKAARWDSKSAIRNLRVLDDDTAPLSDDLKPPVYVAPFTKSCRSAGPLRTSTGFANIRVNL